MRVKDLPSLSGVVLVLQGACRTHQRLCYLLSGLVGKIVPSALDHDLNGGFFKIVDDMRHHLKFSLTRGLVYPKAGQYGLTWTNGTRHGG